MKLVNNYTNCFFFLVNKSYRNIFVACLVTLVKQNIFVEKIEPHKSSLGVSIGPNITEIDRNRY